MSSSSAEKAGLVATGGLAAWFCLKAAPSADAARAASSEEQGLRQDLAAAREHSPLKTPLFTTLLPSPDGALPVR